MTADLIIVRLWLLALTISVLTIPLGGGLVKRWREVG
jgi:hypothetical protein